MKKVISLILLIIITLESYSQTSGTITVGGDFNKYYPVTWTDPAWQYHKPSYLSIGRSDIHENGFWRGSLIAEFQYHMTAWGHGSSFIEATIRNASANFIAGWRDASANGYSHNIIIWLRGGGTSYHFTANYPINVVVYDGERNPLPYQESNGPTHTYKTFIDSYVNPNGISNPGVAYFNGGGSNFFHGNVGIGMLPTEKLTVNGNIRAKEIKVEADNWPDYVFEEGFKAMSLESVERFIQHNRRLPEMPSEAEVKSKGIELGQMNVKLLKKIEELTLYLIELKKQNEKQQVEIDQLKNARI